MSQVVGDFSAGQTVRETASTRAWVGQAVALGLLVGFIYYNILAQLGLAWLHHDDYSHGILIPFFSAFVVWRLRKRLAVLPFNPDWSGMAVIAGSLGVLIVGSLGAELFLSRISFVFLLAGLVICFFGWNCFRILLFPWAFLFLMIPIPAILLNQITFPLQLLASRFASFLLPLMGVPVLREGNVLQLPGIDLEVVQACSGIRSLMSLATLAIMYGYLAEPRIARRVLLAFAAVPIAIIANGLRIVGTGVLVHFGDPNKAEGFFHAFSGWVIFILSMVMLFSLHGVMRLIDRRRDVRSP